MDVTKLAISDGDITVREGALLQAIKNDDDVRLRYALVLGRVPELTVNTLMELTAKEFIVLEKNVFDVFDKLAERYTQEREAERREQAQNDDPECCDNPDCPARMLAEILFGRPRSRRQRKPDNDNDVTLKPEQRQSWEKLRGQLD